MNIRYIVLLFLVLLKIAFAEDYRTIQRNTPIVTRDRVSHKTIENFGEYYALLIYVEKYNNTDVYPILDTPKNDVESLAEILNERYNFPLKNITIVNNPKNSDDLMREFDRLENLLKENDNLLIYYAGHGGIKKSTGKGYWNLANAVDLDKVGRQGSVSLDEAILNSLVSIKSKHILVISDSCYSGILTRGKKEETLGNVSENEKKYYQGIYERYSRTALVSGGLTPVRDHDIVDKKHSIFASSLLKVLKRNKQPIFALNEKYKEISKYVSNNTNNQQVPEYEGLKNSGQEPNGDFIFIDNKSVLKNKNIKPIHDESDISVPLYNRTNVSKTDTMLMWLLGIVSFLLLVVSVIYYRKQKSNSMGNKEVVQTPPSKRSFKKPFETTMQGVITMGKLTYQNQLFTQQMTWQEAKEYAKNLRLGGFDDWRLPSLKELRALGNVELYNGEDNEPFWKEWYQNNKDYALSNPKGEKHFINEKLVKNMPQYSIFWTSEAKDEDDVYLVAFHLGCNYADYDTSKHYVLCVRNNNK